VVDMYNPALDAHMTCTTSAVRVWRKYGWVPYTEWLAAQQPTGTDPAATETTDPTTV
jgi:hypothetical protein